MKRISISVGLLLSVLGVSGAEQSVHETGGYVIEGSIAGKYEGKVYLMREESLKGKQIAIDSTDVKDGKFRFEGGPVAVSLIHFIRSTDGQLAPFFLENGTIRMAIDSGNFLWDRVSGTPNNNLRDLYTLESNFVRDSVTRATVADWSIYGRKDENYENEQFKRRSALIGRRWLDIQRDLVKRYPGQAFAPFLIMFEMVSDVSLDELKSLRAGLAPELSGHPYTLALDDYIANQSFGVGAQAYDFTLPTIDGKEISLKDYAGKYVFLDFWASWCGPCRREVPFVKELHRKFGGKQLEVIGISVDRDGKKWRDAVRELGMKWTQCCDLEEWNSIVARRYNVQAVPRTVLIDSQGKVAAIDLRGKQLIEEVEKILKK